MELRENPGGVSAQPNTELESRTRAGNEEGLMAALKRCATQNLIDSVQNPIFRRLYRTIPNDQLTVRINGSGKMPMTMVASAATPTAVRMARGMGSLALSPAGASRMNMAFAIRR